jgi:hypothetical protein
VARQTGKIDFETIVRRFDTYQIALERLLGVNPGTLQVVDEQMIRLWFGKENQ